MKLRDVYELKHALGKGNYGDVLLVENKRTGQQHAAKSIHKKAHWTVQEFQKRVAQVRLVADASRLPCCMEGIKFINHLHKTHGIRASCTRLHAQNLQPDVLLLVMHVNESAGGFNSAAGQAPEHYRADR